MSDRLTPIPVSELGELRALLSIDFPRHLGAYGLIATLEEWHRETPVVEHIKIFTLNGDWREDGLFVVTDRCDLFLNSMTGDNERLRRALKLIDWSRGWRIVQLDSKSHDDTLSVLSELQVPVEYDLPFDTLFCPPELAIGLKYTVPDNVVVRRLQPSETDTVNGLWTYRHTNSEVGVRRLIERNYCVGAYDKTSGQLLGWCLTFISQCHNALQIEPKFMGRGLGRLITSKLAHERALQGKWSHAYVAASNTASQGLFKSCGFVKIGYVYWLATLPRQ